MLASGLDQRAQVFDQPFGGPGSHPRLGGESRVVHRPARGDRPCQLSRGHASPRAEVVIDPRNPARAVARREILDRQAISADGDANGLAEAVRSGRLVVYAGHLALLHRLINVIAVLAVALSGENYVSALARLTQDIQYVKSVK